MASEDPPMSVEVTRASLSHPNVAWVKGKTVSITGGCGYLGRRLALLLAERGAKEIRILDRNPTKLNLIPRPDDPRAASTLDNVVFFGPDIRDGATVSHCLKGADVVFHMCSYGMSGTEMLNREMTRSVNIDGTAHVVRACEAEHVKCLVYTSTVNVVFNGQEIVLGTEDSLPLLRSGQHVDTYSGTKAEAEAMVLAASQFSPSKTTAASTPPAPSPSLNASKVGHPSPSLACVALRPNGIYGENEERHLPRIVHLASKGLYAFRVGSSKVLMDWSYADNLALAHVVAAGAALSRPAQVSGKAFFITDRQPVSAFDHFIPVLAAVGLSTPSLYLPFGAAYAAAWLIEIVHAAMGALSVSFSPLLTRAEVNKVGVLHTFDTRQAETELQFIPPVRPAVAMARVAEWYAKKHRRKYASVEGLGMWSAAVAFFFIFLLIALFIRSHHGGQL